MRRFLSLHSGFGALLLATLGATNQASAQPASASDPAVADDEAPLDVELRASESALQPSVILQALERELGVPVRSSASGRGLLLELEARRLRASYSSAEGRVVERTVTLPEEPERQLDTIALLAGNLARDEAGRLLTELRSPPAEPVEAERAPAQREPAAQAEAPGAPEPEAFSKGGLAPLDEQAFNFSVFAPVALNPRAFEREVSMELGLFYGDIGRLRGVGLNAFVLETRGGGSGVQLAGVLSLQGGETRGIQASVVSSTADRLTGAQLGVVNHAGAEVSGAQVGLVNLGGGLSGAQVGLVNIQTGAARGAQVGLVNIAGESKGASFGLVQISPSIRAQALAWASWAPDVGGSATPRGPMAHVGVKYLMSHFYTMLGFGVADAERRCPGRSCIDGDAVLAPSFGVGGRVALAESFFLELDSLYQWEFSSDAGLDSHHSLQARGTLGWQVTDGLALVAGGGPRSDYSPSFEDWTYSPSFHAGIQLF